MKLGARILKTGIAIILAVAVASLLPHNPSMTAVAGISAVVAMQPTVYRTLKTIVDQFQGNVIGAILAVIMVTLFGSNFVIMGATVILLIAILYKMKIAHVATLASVTALIIMGQHDGSFYMSAFFRFVLVMIGVLSSFIVNLTFLPPKFETKLYHNSMNISTEIFQLFKLVLNESMEFHHIKDDVQAIKTRVNKLDQLYLLFKEERRSFSRKKSFEQTRKKVLFNQLVLTTRRAYDVLRKMHRYQNDLHLLGPDLLLQVQLEIHDLITYHEQVLISISKNSHFDVIENLTHIKNPQKTPLFEAFKHELIDHPDQDAYNYENIMQIIASIEEYRNHIEHLDVIRLSFFKYHHSDRELNIVEEDYDL
ncbi:FUSC family protein [Staphylococcus massiliensis]|uniref:Lipoprotein n=1 Tax=Staphylococcus massiliensis S46 TaxID=1229783 RepID=K9ADC4_9STAP|nr:aromatic acid exporter family protein [Staphylococcus massiliensis]EKU45243.1 lipoprotein [Staphylococcus massiliensis S46]PNZ97200.1 aromatic acid exporter family protein [Staphylococcus massiliensis CCUG 55927]